MKERVGDEKLMIISVTVRGESIIQPARLVRSSNAAGYMFCFCFFLAHPLCAKLFFKCIFSDF